LPLRSTKTVEGCKVGWTVALLASLKSGSKPKLAKTPRVSTGTIDEKAAVALEEVSFGPGETTVSGPPGKIGQQNL
jgi:hypothetical protein